jgi:hypothetical protein
VISSVESFLKLIILYSIPCSKCYIFHASFFVFVGLIVGALIKYTTNAPTAVYMDVSDAHEVSNGTYSPPTYIRLTVRLHNDSNISNIVEVEQQQYEYSLLSLIPSEEPNSSTQSHNSIELDTTVNYQILLLCMWFQP